MRITRPAARRTRAAATVLVAWTAGAAETESAIARGARLDDDWFADNGADRLHKILNGQPGEALPALPARDHQIAADIAVYLSTLPGPSSPGAGRAPECGPACTPCDFYPCWPPC